MPHRSTKPLRKHPDRPLVARRKQPEENAAALLSTSMKKFLSNAVLAALSATLPSMTLAYNVQSMPYLRENSCTRLNDTTISETRVSDRRCAEQRLATTQRTQEHVRSQASTTQNQTSARVRTRTQSTQSIAAQRTQTTERKSSRMVRQETETLTRAARLQQWKSE